MLPSGYEYVMSYNRRDCNRNCCPIDYFLTVVLELMALLLECFNIFVRIEHYQRMVNSTCVVDDIECIDKCTIIQCSFVCCDSTRFHLHSIRI